jgi:hypothetical protein
LLQTSRKIGAKGRAGDGSEWQDLNLRPPRVGPGFGTRSQDFGAFKQARASRNC